MLLGASKARQRELHELAVCQREPFGEQVRREAKGFQDLAGRELDPAKRGLPIEACAFIKSFLMPDKSLCVCIRIVRILPDDLILSSWYPGHGILPSGTSRHAGNQNADHRRNHHSVFHKS